MFERLALAAERVDECDVGRRIGVGIAERAHRDVLDRPRPDAGNLRERRASRGDGAARERQLAVARRDSEAMQRFRALHRQADLGDRRRAGVRERGRIRESARSSPSWPALERARRYFATRRSRQRARALHGDLLAEHRADRGFKAIQRARHAHARFALHVLAPTIASVARCASTAVISASRSNAPRTLATSGRRCGARFSESVSIRPFGPMPISIHPSASPHFSTRA